MQTVSALYTEITTGLDYWFETKLEIRDPSTDALIGSYDETQLFSLSTSSELLRETLEIGKAIAAEIDVRMLKPNVEIPTMAKLMPYVRACNATQQSEWLPQGIFFIDTRESTTTQTGKEVLSIHGYDPMLKAERTHTKAGTYLDKDLVNSIAKAIGLKNGNIPKVDPRTWNIIPSNGRYTFPVTPFYTMRDTLRNIASAYGGWFVVTETGYLRLISVSEFPAETRYLVDESHFPIVFGTGDNAARILV